MLFILGEFLSELSNKYYNNIMKIYVSKAQFIDVMKKMKIVVKQPRAIYKNLEELQKNKLIVYSQKKLRLSRGGLITFEKLKKELDEYYGILGKLKSNKIYFKRNTQAKLEFNYKK